jgi:hypothetical protein
VQTIFVLGIFVAYPTHGKEYLDHTARHPTRPVQTTVHITQYAARLAVRSAPHADLTVLSVAMPNRPCTCPRPKMSLVGFRRACLAMPLASAFGTKITLSTSATTTSPGCMSTPPATRGVFVAAKRGLSRAMLCGFIADQNGGFCDEVIRAPDPTIGDKAAHTSQRANLRVFRFHQSRVHSAMVDHAEIPPAYSARRRIGTDLPLVPVYPLTVPLWREIWNCPSIGHVS